MRFVFQVRHPRSLAGWAWTFLENISGTGLLLLIALRLAGVIGWSWWWVLAPLWVNGIILGLALATMLVLIVWGRLPPRG